jgi:sugar-specific transcriptional regulator TrmB
MKQSPLNGYEAAKASGVTRTMIYDVLSRLVSKGFVRKIESKPLMYTAVNYKDVIEQLEDDQKQNIERARKVLKNLESDNDEMYYIFNLEGGKKQLHDQIVSHIKKAVKSIYIFLWDNEVEVVREELQKAEKRGVKIFIFSFCNLSLDVGVKCTYSIFGLDEEELFPERRIIAVFDHEKLVIGSGNGGSNEISMLTSNPVFISMAVDQIVLDMLLLKTMEKFGGYKQGMTFHQYKSIRDKFLENLNLPEYYPMQENDKKEQGNS